uniref:Uncharacterized protein n=1 Tax=Anguilla anguilla TaxID=7936 RepID=A0A0E9QDQ8_ANGAN
MPFIFIGVETVVSIACGSFPIVQETKYNATCCCLFILAVISRHRHLLTCKLIVINKGSKK